MKSIRHEWMSLPHVINCRSPSPWSALSLTRVAPATPVFPLPCCEPGAPVRARGQLSSCAVAPACPALQPAAGRGAKQRRGTWARARVGRPALPAPVPREPALRQDGRLAPRGRVSRRHRKAPGEGDWLREIWRGADHSRRAGGSIQGRERGGSGAPFRVLLCAWRSPCSSTGSAALSRVEGNIATTPPGPMLGP